MKKLMSVLLVLAMAFALVACGSSNTPAATTAATAAPAADTTATEAPAADNGNALLDADGNPFHIGIVTGSVSQSEDDRRGAEAFQAEYGEDMVKLATYPDNFGD